MFPCADKLHWDADFNCSAGSGTCPHSKRYQKLVQWPWCYCAWLASKQGCCKSEMRDPTMYCRWPEGGQAQCLNYPSAIITKSDSHRSLKYFPVRVMNVCKITVSLSETADKKYLTFTDLDVPVYQCCFASLGKLTLLILILWFKNPKNETPPKKQQWMCGEETEEA